MNLNEFYSKNVQRASSVDSLEQTDFVSTAANESLRFISGYHKWININDKIRVDKIIDNHHNNHQIDFIIDNDDNSNQQKTLLTNDIEIIIQTKSVNEEEEEDNDENNLSHMDISLNHFDVQLQVDNGQLQQVIRYGVFSSIYQTDKINLFKINQSSQTSEMDMDNGDRHNGKTNGYSQHRNNKDESHRRNRRMNGSSNNHGNGNGSNPNRNNNNARR